MRLGTIAAIGVIAASTAALAQVASSPDEQKVPVAGESRLGNDMAVPDSDMLPANEVSADTTSPPANATDPAPIEPKAERRTPRR